MPLGLITGGTAAGSGKFSASRKSVTAFSSEFQCSLQKTVPRLSSSVGVSSQLSTVVSAIYEFLVSLIKASTLERSEISASEKSNSKSLWSFKVSPSLSCSVENSSSDASSSSISLFVRCIPSLPRQFLL